MRQMQTKATQRPSAQTEQRAIQAQPDLAGQRMSRPQGNAGLLLSLQRSHGNRFVQRFLDVAVLQRACDRGGTCADCQTKLTVSQPDDPYEQEADRVAEEVM